jgi:hypothetical protein
MKVLYFLLFNPNACYFDFLFCSYFSHQGRGKLTVENTICRTLTVHGNEMVMIGGVISEIFGKLVIG